MNPSRIHFIAIGGSVMHNLAVDLQKRGSRVSGSDDEIYDPARSRLQRHGLLPEREGWFPEKITADLDVVILGMHARSDNPELVRAQELGLPILSYPEFMYQQCEDKQRVVVAGSHGKTTITAMILHVLQHHHRKFDYLVGAGLDGFENMVQLTDEAPIVIIEGDEYLSSAVDPEPKFLKYQHHIGVISGIAWDHVNVFPTFESYVRQFEHFADATPKGGALIFDGTDDLVAVICRKEREDVTPQEYGVHRHRIANGETFLITDEGEIPVAFFGEHNLRNLNAARLVCHRLGVYDKAFYEAIRTFRGAALRLQPLGKNESTAVFRDFAHAPSKLEASTQAVRDQFPKRKLVAVAELHTFSSLNKEFVKQYKDTFSLPDQAIVYYNPATVARKNMELLSEDDLKAAFNNRNLLVFTDTEKLAAFLHEQDWSGKNLLLMSSGHFGSLDLEALTTQVLGAK